MSILQNCPSCGKSYLEHLGLIGTCKKLQEVTKERYELLSALKEVMLTHDEDIGMDDYDDSESVGSEQSPGGDVVDMKLTFGVLRRARALISRIEAGRA